MPGLCYNVKNPLLSSSLPFPRSASFENSGITKLTLIVRKPYTMISVFLIVIAISPKKI